MGLRINTNIVSLNAQRHLSGISRAVQSTYSHLSSGLRIATAADDAAGLGIAERLRVRADSFGVALVNIDHSTSLLETMEGAMGEMTTLTGRLRELALQAMSGHLNIGDRATINTEFQSVLAEIERIATSTEYNGNNLLDVDGLIRVQVGAAVDDEVGLKTRDLTTATLGLAGEDTSTVAGATSALAAVDSAMDTINLRRGQNASSVRQLATIKRKAVNTQESLRRAHSTIRDADIADETASSTRLQILQQSATSVLSQANVQPQIALQLLRG